MITIKDCLLLVHTLIMACISVVVYYTCQRVKEHILSYITSDLQECTATQ